VKDVFSFKMPLWATHCLRAKGERTCFRMLSVERRNIPADLSLWLYSSSFFRWHYSPMQTFASLIDFSQSVVNFAFIVPALYKVRTFQVDIIISFTVFHCLRRFRSFGLTRGYILGYQTVNFYGERLSAFSPNFNLEG
jgi:hypothetical protein